MQDGSLLDTTENHQKVGVKRFKQVEQSLFISSTFLKPVISLVGYL